MFRDKLRVEGWTDLPRDTPSHLILIHKVSGSLTNAVFFVSIPVTEFVLTSQVEQHNVERLTVLGLGDETGRATPTPEKMIRKETVNGNKAKTIRLAAPTVLLRIYGPSSGSLISRKSELHILHTLSKDYLIGPQVLGTFLNGRVEEYFHSRAMTKDEMREEEASRWIGRRMRELHGVDLSRMEIQDESGAMPMRPDRSTSRGSIYSNSSGSSIFSFGTSIYSTSSAGSTTSLTTINDDNISGTPVVSSPLLLPRRDSTESKAGKKKRGRGLGGARGSKDKLGVWENITRWTREAKLVLKLLDEVANLPNYQSLIQSKPSPQQLAQDHLIPLEYLSETLELRKKLNLPLFESQVKLYRSYISSQASEPSPRVFSHNDTQYGNLLLMIEEGEVLRAKGREHEKIIVVDFEYAGKNPRGFDLANHFIEWQADCE